MKKGRMLLIGAALAAVLLWLGIRLKMLIGILLWSVVLAYLLLPLCRWWEKFLPRRTASGVSLLSMLLVGGGFVALVIPGLITQVRMLIAQLPAMAVRLLEEVQRAEAWMEGHLGFSVSLPSQGLEKGITDTILAWLGSVRWPDVSTLSYGLLIPLISGYLLADREEWLQSLLYLIPVRWRGEVSRVTERIHQGLAGYVRGQLWVTVFVGGMTGLGLFAVGVPYALILGIVMTVCNVIPYFGPLIGSVPIALVAAAAGGNRWIAAMAVVIAVQQLENLLITPRIMGSSLQMKPLPVILSVLAGGMLAGMAGMVLALPVVIALREWLGYFMDQMTLPRIKVTD